MGDGGLVTTVGGNFSQDWRVGGDYSGLWEFSQNCEGGRLDRAVERGSLVRTVWGIFSQDCVGDI